MGLEIASLAAYAAIGNVGLSALGSLSQNNAEVTKNKEAARLSSLRAQLVESQGREEAALATEQGLRIRSKAINALADQGTAIDGQTSSAILAGLSKAVDRDADVIRRQANINAAGYRYNAAQYKSAAKNVGNNKWLNFGTTLLGGASRVYLTGAKANWWE